MIGMSYELEKSIWTEEDFEVMSWHDSQIYKMALKEDLEFDIDYIFKWNQPDLEGLLSSKEYIEAQEKIFEHYENVKKRHLKRQEMKELNLRRENHQVETKEYLLKKKGINEMIDFYDYWLKGTDFEKW
ncbi:hypothetical protein FHW36_112124 [Chitinophaga polysaccharea]|uniref:Uncharacterized protein n=2 Tax=Chitinophaga polysaccharea TaxID=1293035 RepID=A0A561P6D9_9BACT|nr:hypothetical protein FHW36_112124 [Chitinophaga polysaccharea]